VPCPNLKDAKMKHKCANAVVPAVMAVPRLFIETECGVCVQQIGALQQPQSCSRDALAPGRVARGCVSGLSALDRVLFFYNTLATHQQHISYTSATHEQHMT
jgi:hypothetical protein